MTEIDTYLNSRMRDELMSQNKKLNRIVEQLEIQTRLQDGILKQLYLLCQMTSRDSTTERYKLARKSDEAFMNTPIPGEKFSENQR